MRHTPPQKIIIVGAGIVGASLAYHLARKGVSITVVDAEDIASGVTGRTFGWINTSRTGPDPIRALRSAAIHEYRRLEAELPELQVQWTGALTYGEAAAPGLQTTASTATANMVTRAQVLALEPGLRHPPHQAWYAPEQGAVDAVKAAHALIAGAQAHGAKLLTRTPVLGLMAQGTQITGVETSAGVLDADLVVLAAGTGIAKLVERFHMPLPIEASPAIFIRYRPRPKLLHTIVSGPTMEVRQATDGVLLAAEDYISDSAEDQPAAVAQRTARAIEDGLQEAAPVEPEWSCIGLRPIPRDGLPIIGYPPQVAGLYVCTMHPGVTLAAVVGRLASEEIVDGQQDPALAPCRPERFLAPHSESLPVHASV